MQTNVVPRKAKRQYLLTLQVRRYCLLALQISVAENINGETTITYSGKYGARQFFHVKLGKFYFYTYAKIMVKLS